MSIFDDLTKDSFLSKKATNKQSGFSRKADAEVAYDLAARKRGDAEAASDFSERNKADIKAASRMDARKEDTEAASDLSANNKAKAATDNISNTEFSSALGATDAETASDMSPGNQYGTQTYSHAGVAFNKLSESEARINYSGLLAKDGAQQVIGVYGYGSNQNWENVSTVTLSKDYSGTFTATIPIVSGKNINFAFKDTAENWDNNSGLNYTFVN